LTAWWVGKFYNTDLRGHRSGNLGARNAGAVIGKSAFLLTFLGDALKGVLVILAGRYFGYSEWAVAMGGLLVICGHLFPFWLKGKGGKGIATFVGIGLTFNVLFAIVLVSHEPDFYEDLVTKVWNVEDWFQTGVYVEESK